MHANQHHGCENDHHSAPAEAIDGQAQKGREDGRDGVGDGHDLREGGGRKGLAASVVCRHMRMVRRLPVLLPARGISVIILPLPSSSPPPPCLPTLSLCLIPAFCPSQYNSVQAPGPLHSSAEQSISFLRKEERRKGGRKGGKERSQGYA